MKKVRINKAELAFDMQAVTEDYKNTKEQAYQALDIAAPETTKPNADGETQKYITVTFVPLGDDSTNDFDFRGGDAIKKAIFENSNRNAFIRAERLYEQVRKIEDPIAKASLIKKYISRDMKVVNTTSLYGYTPINSKTGKPFIDRLTGEEVVTKNVTLFLFPSDKLYRELQAKTRAIGENWIKEIATDNSYDPASGTTASDLITDEDAEKELGLK